MQCLLNRSWLQFRLYSNTPRLTDVGFWDVFGEYFGSIVQATQSGLELMHYNGLPWWSTIVVGAVSIRLVLLPARIAALMHQTRMQRASSDIYSKLPELRSKIQQKIRDEQIGKTELQSFAKFELGKEWLRTVRERGTHPLRGLLPLMLHLPTFFTLTAALRRMSAYHWPFCELSAAESMVPGWENGGILFFSNLGASSLWLTMVVAVSNFAIIESIFRDKVLTEKKRIRMLRWLMHGLNGISFYLLSMIPSAINFFILCNNGLTAVERTALGSAMMKSWVERITK